MRAQHYRKTSSLHVLYFIKCPVCERTSCQTTPKTYFENCSRCWSTSLNTSGSPSSRAQSSSRSMHFLSAAIFPRPASFRVSSSAIDPRNARISYWRDRWFCTYWIVQSFVIYYSPTWIIAFACRLLSTMSCRIDDNVYLCDSIVVTVLFCQDRHWNGCAVARYKRIARFGLGTTVKFTEFLHYIAMKTFFHPPVTVTHHRILCFCFRSFSLCFAAAATDASVIIRRRAG